ncbi:hypothetical protein ABK040_006345 [Willaertia magna]
MPHFSLKGTKNRDSISSGSSPNTSTSPSNFSNNNTTQRNRTDSEIKLSPETVEKIEKIGEGAFGEVWKGYNKLTGETVAIKIIDLEEATDEIEDIQKEVHVQMSTNSPYVVKVYGAFINGSYLWIVMDLLLCSIQDIMEILTKQHQSNEPIGLDEKHIAVIMKETLKGLDYLHTENKIHRDIKSANILISKDCQIKIGDFGVSGQLTSTLGNRKRYTFVGTPYYMAPEVIVRQGYTEKADIWSLGITAYEMFKGSPPLSNLKPFQALLKIPRENPPRLEDPRASKQFKEFIEACLEKEPSLRPSAKDLLKHKFIKGAKKNTILTELVEVKLNYVKPTQEEEKTKGQYSSEDSDDSDEDSDDSDDSDDDEEGGATVVNRGNNMAWDFGTVRESKKTNEPQMQKVGVNSNKSSNNNNNGNKFKFDFNDSDDDSDDDSDEESDDEKPPTKPVSTTSSSFASNNSSISSTGSTKSTEQIYSEILCETLYDMSQDDLAERFQLAEASHKGLCKSLIEAVVQRISTKVDEGVITNDKLKNLLNK